QAVGDRHQGIVAHFGLPLSIEIKSIRSDCKKIGVKMWSKTAVTLSRSRQEYTKSGRLFAKDSSGGRRNEVTQRVLVVDEEQAMRRLLRASLTAQGYAVWEASTGEEALQAAPSARPDLILM